MGNFKATQGYRTSGIGAASASFANASAYVTPVVDLGLTPNYVRIQTTSAWPDTAQLLVSGGPSSTEVVPVAFSGISANVGIVSGNLSARSYYFDDLKGCRYVRIGTNSITGIVATVLVWGVG